MARVLGIDLGTTNTCCAILEGGEAVLIPNREGSRLTPSAVAFTADGERLVGAVAKRQAITNSENTVFSIKRIIGRPFDSEEVSRFMKTHALKLQPLNKNEVGIVIRDVVYPASEISSFILKRIKEFAEEFLGEPVKEAVVTVPAYFDDRQREATRKSGELAGLEVLRIINEPTAAALAYGFDKTARERIAVYDLGGGTFDISILEIEGGVFAVRSTTGDTYLGGDDFDERIINWVVEQFLEKEGVDLRQDRQALQRLKEAAERAKCELSSVTVTDINLPFITSSEGSTKHLEFNLTREKLEELVSDLVDRTIEKCAEALSDGDLSKEDIDEIVLVGGQSRMPKIQEKVLEFFSIPPRRNVNPDEVVAIGAAVQGSILKGEIKDIVLLDVTPLSLGVRTYGGLFTKIVERNSNIPLKTKRVFTTVEDNQSSVVVDILQGERDIANYNKSLGTFELDNISPAPRGTPRVTVTFNIDENGLVTVMASDVSSGKERKLEIGNTAAIPTSEVQAAILDAELHVSEDRRKIDAIKAINQGKLIINDAYAMLKDAALAAPIHNELQEAISKLEEYIALEDVSRIKNSSRYLTRIMHRARNLGTASDIDLTEGVQFSDEFSSEISQIEGLPKFENEPL